MTQDHERLTRLRGSAPSLVRFSEGFTASPRGKVGEVTGSYFGPRNPAPLGTDGDVDLDELLARVRAEQPVPRATMVKMSRAERRRGTKSKQTGGAQVKHNGRRHKASKAKRRGQGQKAKGNASHSLPGGVPRQPSRKPRPAPTKRSRADLPLEAKATDQPAHPDDVAAVGYGPGETPQIPAKYRHLKVEHESGGNRKQGFNDRLRHPEPDRVYLVDDFLFVTDDHGRVVHAEGWLKWLPASASAKRRDHESQKLAGYEYRQAFDQGGHIVAAKFGGPGEIINIAAQTNTINNSQPNTTLENNYGRLEEHWLKLREAGVQVHASFEISYPDQQSLRPDARTVSFRSQGRQDPTRVYRERPPTRGPDPRKRRPFESEVGLMPTDPVDRAILVGMTPKPAGSRHGVTVAGSAGTDTPLPGTAPVGARNRNRTRNQPGSGRAA